ncbi:MAG: SWIM zinc finger family protein [Rhodothermales bacterium]|jgi:predicted nucleic acid-binding Zn finger protein
MTAKELQNRNAKAENLRVLQTEDGSYYVESAEGKILYNVVLNDDDTSCTCGDFVKNIRQDANFRCKHILAVRNCVSTGGVESAKVLDRKRPKLDERWIIEIEGNQFVKYGGLLDLGHQKGISQIEVEPLQFPTKDNGNAAICNLNHPKGVGRILTRTRAGNLTPFHFQKIAVPAF